MIPPSERRLALRHLLCFKCGRAYKHGDGPSCGLCPACTEHYANKCDNCEDRATHVYGEHSLCDDCWWICDDKRVKMERQRAHDANCDRMLQELKEGGR